MNAFALESSGFLELNPFVKTRIPLKANRFMYGQSSSPNKHRLSRTSGGNNTVSPTAISAFSTDQIPPYAQHENAATMPLAMGPQNFTTNGVEIPNPWSGAFTKTFMRNNSYCSAGMENDRSAGEVARPYSLTNKLTAEFVGTLFFVFVGSLCTLKSGDNAVIHSAFAHGLAIFVMVASLGHISGGHFNPAVSLGIAVSGKMKPQIVPLYWVAQLSGGFCASLLVWLVANQSQVKSVAVGATIVPSSTENWHQALIMEVMLTAILVQTVLTCAVDTKSNSLAPLAIGMAITLDIFAGAAISGASMNPARSFGPCLAASLVLGESIPTKLSDPIWTLHFVYWAGPFIGAIVAAALYRTLFGREDNRIVP